MKLTVKQLRTLIKEAVSEFSSKQEFEEQLAAAEKRAYNAYMHFQHADRWPNAEAKKEEQREVDSTAAEVERLKKLGTEMGWIAPAKPPTPQQPSKLPKFVRGEVEWRWLELMKRFPTKADLLADRWDALVKEAPRISQSGGLQKLDPKMGKVVGWGVDQLVTEVMEELGATDERTRLDVHDVINRMVRAVGPYRWTGTSTTGFDLLAAMKE